MDAAREPKGLLKYCRPSIFWGPQVPPLQTLSGSHAAQFYLPPWPDPPFPTCRAQGLLWSWSLETETVFSSLGLEFQGNGECKLDPILSIKPELKPYHKHPAAPGLYWGVQQGLGEQLLQKAIEASILIWTDVKKIGCWCRTPMNMEGKCRPCTLSSGILIIVPLWNSRARTHTHTLCHSPIMPGGRR